MAGPNEVRLSDIESRFICKAGGKRGADMRPDFVRREETRPATEAKLGKRAKASTSLS